MLTETFTLSYESCKIFAQISHPACYGSLRLLQEEREARLMDEVLPDIAKAFDSLSHRLGLTNLTFSCIDGPVLNWTKPFLSDRLYQV